MNYFNFNRIRYSTLDAACSHDSIRRFLMAHITPALPLLKDAWNKSVR